MKGIANEFRDIAWHRRHLARITHHEHIRKLKRLGLYQYPVKKSERVISVTTQLTQTFFQKILLQIKKFLTKCRITSN